MKKGSEVSRYWTVGDSGYWDWEMDGCWVACGRIDSVCSLGASTSPPVILW